ncbi:hypothetical protein QQ045_028354 [Rhodiola kirilowii]
MSNTSFFGRFTPAEYSLMFCTIGAVIQCGLWVRSIEATEKQGMEALEKQRQKRAALASAAAGTPGCGGKK